MCYNAGKVYASRPLVIAPFVSGQSSTTAGWLLSSCTCTVGLLFTALLARTSTQAARERTEKISYGFATVFLMMREEPYSY